MYDQATADLMTENKNLKAQLQAANSAAHSLAAQLCGVREVSEKDGYTLIRRESVMELVTRWRTQWDAAMKVPNGKA